MKNPSGKWPASPAWLPMVILLLIPGCLLDKNSKEDDLRKLAEMRDVIELMVENPVCSDSADCAYIGLGSKPCGGPWRYIIYSKATVNEEALEQRVAEYNEFERIINRRYGLISDCSIPNLPRIGCLDGVCVDLNEYLDTQPFVRLAQAETCAEMANRLFVIDEAAVFWDRRGVCGDDARYAWILFGKTVDDILFLQVDSTPLFVYCDGPSHPGSVRELIETILGNLDEDDLGLGTDHVVREIAVPPTEEPQCSSESSAVTAAHPRR